MSRSMKVFACAVAALLLFAGVSWGQTPQLTREKMPNDVGIELLGKSLLYTFYYQRNLNRNFALEAGLSAIGGGSLEDNATIVFVPVGAKLYLIPKNGSIYLAGGGVFLSASTDTGPFGSDSASTTYGYAGPGFEFRSDSGFLFRGQAYGLLAGGGFFIWPGLTLGYAF